MTTEATRTIEQLHPGGHICALYESQSEHLAVLTQFHRHGLTEGARCIHIADDSPVDAFLHALGKAGADVDRDLARGALRVLPPDAVYLKGRVFDPDEVIAFWREALDDALRAGFSGLYVSGDVTWVLQNAPGVERLGEYEAKITRAISGSRMRALCCYSRQLLPADVLASMFSTHPLMVFGDRVLRCGLPSGPAAEDTGPAGEWLKSLLQLLRHSEDQVREALRLNEKLLEVSPAGIYTCDAEGLITYFNQRAVQVWGREPKLDSPEDRFCGSFKLYWADGSPIRHDQCWMALTLQTDQPYDGREVVVERPDGSRVTVLAHAHPLYDDAGHLSGAVNVLVDITDRKRAEYLLDRENRLLEMVATGTPSSQVLGALNDLIEEQDGGLFSSVLLLDQDAQRLRVGPSSPALEGYNRAVEGAPAVPPYLGPCCMAAHLGATVTVSDIATDDRWSDEWRHQALSHGLRACQSTPILSSGGKVLGAFALYRTRPGDPGPADERLIQVATHTASIVLERDQRERDEGRRERERRAEAEADRERIAKILQSIKDAFFAVDRRWRFTYLNDNAAQVMGQLTGKSAEELIGRDMWEELSQFLGSRFYEEYHRAVAEQVSVQFEEFCPQLEVWLEVRAHPSVEGLSVFFQDITQRKQTEEALRESEERFRLATSAGKVGVWDWNIVTNTVTWSDTIYRIHGVEPGTFGGTVEDFAQLIHEDDRDYVSRAIQGALYDYMPYELEFRSVRPDGRIVWIFSHATVVRDASGAPVRMLGGTVDITPLKNAELALRESQERYQLVLDGADAAIWDWDVPARRVLYSPRWKELRGLAEDGISDSEEEWSSGIHPDDYQRVMAAVQAHFQGHTPFFAEEYRVRHRDGHWVWILDRGIAQRDAGGRVVRMAGSETDITERKRAEAALQMREQEVRALNSQLEGRILELETLFDVVPAGIAIATDPECRFMKSNAAMAQMLGVSSDSNVSLSAPPEEMPPFTFQTDGRVIPPQELPMQVSATRGIPLSGVEMDVVRQDGRTVNLLGYTAPLLNGDGTTRGSIGTFLDITERKRAEEDISRLNRELQNLVNKLQTVLQVSPVGLGVAEDPECQFIRVNPAFANMMGISPGINASKTAVPELALPFKVFKDGLEVPGHELPMQVAAARGVDVPGEELDLVKADGTTVSAVVYATPLLDEDGNSRGSVAAIMDITERKRMEEALRKSELELTDFVETATIGLHRVGRDGTITWANRAELQMLGYAPEEYIGHHISEFHADQTVIKDILLRLGNGEVLQNYEATLLAKDGSHRHVLIDSTVFWENGKFSHSRCFTRDETERKQAEEALKEADRRKDEFLAMLSHELRNPLAPIANAVELLRRAPGDSAMQQEALSVLQRQVGTLGRLVDDLLDVSRVTSGRIQLQPEDVDLNTLVQRVADSFRPTMDERRHDFTVSLADTVLWVRGDQTRLEQVMVNLLSNAAKYTPDGGQVCLALAPEGDDALIKVRDSGVGIDSGLLPHIFELFSQKETALNRPQSGLGIGLALVKSLVEMHGGKVTAQSQGPDRGSEFTVRLPMEGAAEPQPTAPPQEAGGPAPSPLRVLLVDDVDDSRRMFAGLVEIMGHQVRTAEDGPGALAAAVDFHPHVALLDVGLPGMDGYEVARRMRQDPGLENTVLVAVTGYGQQKDRRRTREAGFDHHLVKPPDIDALERLLGEIAETAI